MGQSLGSYRGENGKIIRFIKTSKFNSTTNFNKNKERQTNNTHSPHSVVYSPWLCSALGSSSFDMIMGSGAFYQTAWI